MYYSLHVTPNGFELNGVVDFDAIFNHVKIIRKTLETFACLSYLEHHKL